MNSTQALLIAQLDSRREGFTAAELATLVEKGETTVRENLRKLVTDGEVVKDGKNFRRPFHTTTAHEAADGMHAGEFAACEECQLDATMREQMATPVPEDEKRPEHEEQSPEQADLEAALRASLEASEKPAPEAEAIDQPEAPKASETPAKKKYAPRRENPPRPIRKNQKTGSELQVVPSADIPDGFPTEVNAAPWSTLCHTHKSAISTKKIMSAWAYSTNPESFCSGCRTALSTKA